MDGRWVATGYIKILDLRGKVKEQKTCPLCKGKKIIPSHTEKGYRYKTDPGCEPCSR